MQNRERSVGRGLVGVWGPSPKRGTLLSCGPTLHRNVAAYKSLIS